jgi:hypothetical protein
MRAKAALSSMSDISCLPVSTGGARNFFPQLLQVIDFCTKYLMRPEI